MRACRLVDRSGNASSTWPVHLDGVTERRPTYYEFFAGGGMARAGFGKTWDCLFANDMAPIKAATYAANWGADHLVCRDVGRLVTSDLPATADLAWASFPCQDLSLAGDSAGLGHAADVKTRSGVFWPFWALIRGLRAEHRAPRVIVLENVCGLLTSNGGRDFEAICAALAQADYRCGALVLDAVHFVPQSRQRVFIVGISAGTVIPPDVAVKAPSGAWYPNGLITAYLKLPAELQANWVWWDLPRPAPRTLVLADLIEDEPSDVAWRTDDETAQLLAMMSPLNQAKVDAARGAGRRMVGGVYKRTRPGGASKKVQRAEVRFDDVAGCLRTPGGGSSRQTIIVVDGARVRSRLLSSREAARLMGLPADYKLPARYSDAYHLAGDGVCVPVVRHLARWLLEPIIAANRLDAVPMAAE